MKQKKDDKEDKDAALQQINRSHKGLRDKLKKKRKQEKEHKKQKSLKKKENELKKQKKKEKKYKRKEKEKEEESDEDFDGEGGDSEAKVLKYLKRLRIFMEEEADDLFEMFELLDSGGEVDINDLENGKVKNYLKKVFKYLGLKKNPETKEYSKDFGLHPEPLKPKITDLWYQGVDSSDSESDNDDKKSMEEENIKIIEEEREANLVSMEEARKALMHGLQSLPEEKKEEEQEESVEQPNRIKGEEWRSMLDEQFGSLNTDKGYSKLGKKLGPGGGEERTDRDKKIDNFMNDYNSQFRRKTLLEEHQERKKAGAAARGPQERRAFDKDLDVNMSRIDSKKVFQMLNNKDNNLTSRFGNSSSGNKYL